MTSKKQIISIIILIAAVLTEVVSYLPYFVTGAPLGVLG